jgi:hypothetical protein
MHIEEFMFIQKYLTQNMWNIEKIVILQITTCKEIHSKFIFLWKTCILAKGPQKANNL